MNTKTLNNSTRQLLNIGLVANILEFYEFSIYVYLVSVMGQLFLKSAHEITILIQSYAFFIISYLARPLGGLFWGYIGNLKRGTALKISLLLMASSTALIGLLPTYNQVGFLATIMLLILRFLQGFSAGGELPLSACYVYEASSPGYQRSFLCSTVAVSSIIGVLLGSCIATLLFWCFDQAALLAGAWRIPYLLSIPMSLWIFYIRNSIHNSPKIIQGEVEAISTKDRPLAKLIKLKSRVLALLVITGFMNINSYTLFMWMPAYLTHFLRVSPHLAQFANTFGLVCWVLFSLLAGYLVNILGYKRLIVLHTLGMIILCYPLFRGLQSASYIGLLGIHFIFAWLQGGIGGVMMEVLGDSFPQSIRALGMSFVSTLTVTFFGSTAPLICTYFTNKLELLTFPAFYILFFGLLALPVALRLKAPSKSLT